MRVTLISSILVILPHLSAQDLDHFEAASVRHSPRLSTPPGMVPVPVIHGGIGSPDPGEISYQGIWLSNLIMTAYGVQAFQVQSMPSSVASERYDIVAKIPAGATKAQFNVMLQNLLKDRFSLGMHKENREIPVYALVLGPKGAKLKQSALDDPPPPPGAVIGQPNAEGFPTFPPGYAGVAGRPSNGHMRLGGQRAPLSQLTPWLETPLGRHVVDRTGLTGQYDFQLDFEWQTSTPADPAPSVFEAVDRLGLKLESTKAPFEMIVIDHLDKDPTAN
jgi:uncharacterized protein (TIGR03435 family)